MKRKFFSLEKSNQTATLNIYGDITSFPWFEGDVSAVNLSKQLEEMADVSQINVYINSYGGEVAEGLAIYNALKRHKAKVTTYCDGFACSIASVIFMAGDERIMNDSSLLMIHNAWTFAQGDSQALRKQADDLDKITQASVEAYKAHSNITEEEIKSLMNAETWILPGEALSYGFATATETLETSVASQNAWSKLFEILKAHQEKQKDADDDKQNDTETKEPETDSEDDEQDETEETPEDETKDDSEGENDDDETDETDSEDETTQKWSGFFNALIK